MTQWVVVSPKGRIKNFFDALQHGLRVVAQKSVQAHLLCPINVGMRDISD